MTAIEVTDVTVTYGDVRALDGLNLAVDSGSIYGLLGPNGAGKTTTMDVLTGQRVPDSGSATVLGVDPAANPIQVRNLIGILPESASPPSFLSGREYLEFVGSVRNLREIEDRIDSWADRLGFEEVLDVLGTDLSRGQQQKVMVAAAFLHEPDLVVIDEPLANLDPLVQERVRKFIRSYQDAGNTVLLSTHSIEVAADLCSTVGILYEGRLRQTVDPDALGSDESLLDIFSDSINATDNV